MDFSVLLLLILPVLKARFEEYQEYPYARHKNDKLVGSRSHVTPNPESLQREEVIARMSKLLNR